MKNVNPTRTLAWEKLEEHFETAQNLNLKKLFQENPNRAEKFTIKWEDFYVDFSKNLITEETQELLLKLSTEVGLKEAIQDYFGGKEINQTEKRAVLHTALRENKSSEVIVDGKNVIPEVYEVKQKIQKFSEAIISGSKKGFSGLPFTDVVNIGIGGSDLGPAMV
ncbi:MAG TPA: glucose-6-phosphate isomerase, partial [Salinimicrobium sp.]|nr:glucose-6-phosphate isomerase [Salinimicrobium sp.]